VRDQGGIDSFPPRPAACNVHHPNLQHRRRLWDFGVAASSLPLRAGASSACLGDTEEDEP
jgi:hypothetical protein